MYKKFIILVLFCSLVVSQECPPIDTLNVNSAQDDWDIEYINSWNSLEIMTWNLKVFPQSNNTMNDVQEIITDLLPDVINFQEISDLEVFENLTNLLNAYDFIYSPDSWGSYVIAYRKDCVDLVDYSTLFNNSGYEFAWRYPLKASLVWHCGESYIDFDMINVHFKCCGDDYLDLGNEYDEEYRRFLASQILEEYINQETLLGKNIIVAGDFNDMLIDEYENNSLMPLIESENSIFVDFEIAEGSSSNWSYPSWPSHLDHILINSNINNQNFVSEVMTVRVDDYTGYNYYQNNISDHRPVLWKAEINSSEIPQGLVINEIMNNPSLENESDGEWLEITNISDQEIDLYGFLIKDNDFDEHIIDEHILLYPGDYLVLGNNSDELENGGIELDYEYNDILLGNIVDEIIIKHPSGLILDEINYNIQSFPIENGYSMMLTDTNLDNNLSSNWILSTQLMPNGDYGTPGYTNISSCTSIGDINLDTIVNVIDVVVLINAILYESSLNAEEYCQANINQDNEINILDVVLIVGYILE